MTDSTMQQDYLQQGSVPAASIPSCGDVSCEMLVSPIARPKPAPFNIRLQPEIPRVVLLDNNKPNAMAILRGAQAELRRRGVDVKEEILSKPNAGVPLEGELLELLTQERGLLLCGVND